MSPPTALAADARPRFRPDQPVIWRRAGTVQCGDSIVDEITSADVAWVLALDGRLTGAEVRRQCPSIAARRLLQAALAAGALEDSRLTSEALRWTPAERRDRVLDDLAGATHALRDPARAITLVDRRLATSIAVVGEGFLADLLRSMITAGGMSLAAGNLAALSVLAARSHPQSSAGPSTGEHPGPHLPVRAYADTGVCGPLVVPGVTPCLRCHDLHRRDADPAWPLIGVQWAQCADRHAPIDSLLAQQLGTTTVALIRRWIDAPEAVADWSCTAYRVQLPLDTIVAEHRPAHPLCGCQWDALARTS